MDAMGWEKERLGGSQGRRADLSASTLSVPLKHPIHVFGQNCDRYIFLDNALYVGVAAVDLINWAIYERLEDSQVTDFYAYTPRQVAGCHPTSERVCFVTLATLTSVQFKGSPAAFPQLTIRGQTLGCHRLHLSSFSKRPKRCERERARL